jgi:hypothetical protein
MIYARILAGAAIAALGACTQNDTEITKRVQDRLAAEAVTDQVHVTTQRRIVHLEGVVADTHELNRAEMAARNTPGILAVDNRLVVQNPVNLTGATSTPAQTPPRGPTPAPAPAMTTPPAAP